MLTASIGARDSAEITELLEGLVALNVGQMKRGAVPTIWDCPTLRYKREPKGREDWQSALRTFQLKTGDCEDCASWLAASYQFTGKRPDAIAFVYDVRPGLKHVVVKFTSTGELEDICKKIGMRGRG